MFALSRLEWLVLAAALLLCPGFSWSAEPETSLFERLDRDKDGYLSREELAADAAKNGNWIAIDRDRDGRNAQSMKTTPPAHSMSGYRLATTQREARRHSQTTLLTQMQASPDK